MLNVIILLLNTFTGKKIRWFKAKCYYFAWRNIQGLPGNQAFFSCIENNPQYRFVLR